MAKRRGKRFEVVELEFWDHTMSGKKDTDEKPFKCRVWGVMISETKLSYKICTWVCDNDLKDITNRETTVILKSTLCGPPVIFAKVKI